MNKLQQRSKQSSHSVKLYKVTFAMERKCSVIFFQIITLFLFSFFVVDVLVSGYIQTFNSTSHRHCFSLSVIHLGLSLPVAAFHSLTPASPTIPCHSKSSTSPFYLVGFLFIFLSCHQPFTHSHQFLIVDDFSSSQNVLQESH